MTSIHIDLSMLPYLYLNLFPLVSNLLVDFRLGLLPDTELTFICIKDRKDMNYSDKQLSSSSNLIITRHQSIERLVWLDFRNMDQSREKGIEYHFP